MVLNLTKVVQKQYSVVTHTSSDRLIEWVDSGLAGARARSLYFFIAGFMSLRTFYEFYRGFYELTYIL